MIPNIRQTTVFVMLAGLWCFSAGMASAGMTFDASDIYEVQKMLIGKIDAGFINERAIRHEAAERKKNETNQTFVQEHEQYKERLLDLSRQISRLSSEKEALETKKADMFTVLNNREAEFERLKKNMDAKHREIQDLEAHISGIEKSGSETRNAIPFEGYFATVVEAKQLSETKDNLIEAAIDAISRLAIETLNGIAIDSVSEVSNNVLVRDKIIAQISGRFAKDTASYKIDKFFTYKRTPVLIYATKVSVHPFEMPDQVLSEKREFKAFQYWHLKNVDDFNQFAGHIKKNYPIKDSEIDNWRINVATVQEKILDHNQKSTASIIDIVNSHQKSIDEKRERIAQIKAELPNLESLAASAEQSLGRQQEKYEQIVAQAEEISRVLDSKVGERDAHVASQIFSRAEIKDRKYRDPVKETKAIVKDILQELDKEFDQTGRSLTTTVNMGMYEGESEKKLQYRKRFIYADVIPYYLESGDAIVGALVILRANFAAEQVSSAGMPLKEPARITDETKGWLIAAAIGLMVCGLFCLFFFFRRRPAASKAALADPAKPSMIAHPQKASASVDTKKAAVYCRQGDICFKNGDYEKAIELYTKAIGHDPRDDAAYYNRGKVWHHKGEFQKAVDDYTKALDINPKRAEKPYVDPVSILPESED